MPESPAEKQALENLDEVTRSVAWDEYEKGGGGLGLGRFLGRFRRARSRPDPDPADARSLRDVMHEDDPR